MTSSDTEVETQPELVVVQVHDDSIEVPGFVLPVLESLMLSDFDSPRARCGEAIRWLKKHGFVSTGMGRKKPARVTMQGREFGRAAGFGGHEFS